MPVEELTLTEYKITKPPAEEMPVWIDNSIQPKKSCEDDDETCSIMGGRKKSTRKSIRKTVHKSHKKTIGKSIRKSIRKSKKK